MAINSRGTNVHVFATYNDAVQALIIDPIQAGLEPGEDARQLFVIDLIADECIEWHTEHRTDHAGQEVEWLPGCGWCSALGDDPQEFWNIAWAHKVEDGTNV